MILLLAGAIYIVWIAWLVSVYPGLPEEIPIHFNFRGEADDWGSRGMLIAIPIVALLTSGLLLLLPYMANQFINYPVKITEENRVRQERLMRHFLSVLAYIVLALMIYISVAMVQGARAGAESGFQTGGFFFFLAALGIWLAWYFWQSRQLR